ncbi:hypothetical protein B9G55_05005 [Saccharibacillus sp. O16]|nr:hypothetical protein B9G55_05005 [Saccharibacillus sp. O16]
MNRILTDARQARQTMNRIYLRRVQKLILPTPSSDAADPGLLAALHKNIERLGYSFAPELLEAASRLDRTSLIELYNVTVPTLRQMVGDHVKYNPMYPNFPEQVMEASDAELYLRALLHYAAGILPDTPEQPRPELKIQKKTKLIQLGTQAEWMQMIHHLIGANGSLSEEDKGDLSIALRSEFNLDDILPESIPYKENAAYVASILLEEGLADVTRLAPYFSTATDVLRLAAGLSGLDTSLSWAKKIPKMLKPAANPYNLLPGMTYKVDPLTGTVAAAEPSITYHFRKFKRAERRLLLGLLEKSGASLEDMLLQRELWKRLGEILHPGEMRGRYPASFEAFTRLRREKSIPTFRGKVEKGLRLRDPQVIAQLAKRPGELARRMDFLLRSQPQQTEAILEAFATASDQLAVPLLLQLLAHFKHRAEPRKYRVFFPKGNIGKVVAVYNQLPQLDPAASERLVHLIERELVARFAKREPLGRVYIDPQLAQIPVPFSGRSASASLRPLPRGSRVAIPEGDILRLFCWWSNIKDGDKDRRRVDIDLSLVLLDQQWSHVQTLSFYNLKESFGAHSGDITNAPKGASEFIDLNVPNVLKQTRARYALVQVACFTGQAISELPECLAGLMVRHDSQSGDVYDPRTVESRFDLTVDAQQAVPFAVDLWERQLIWMDAVPKNRSFLITAGTNMTGLELLGRAFSDVRRTTLAELYTLHAEARGTLTDRQEEADTVFSMEEGITPYRTDLILGEYL